MGQKVHIAYIDDNPTDSNSNPDKRLMRDDESGNFTIYGPDGSIVSEAGLFGVIEDNIEADPSGTQGDATLLTCGISVVRTANPNASVILNENAALAVACEVSNLTANQIRIYPPVGQTIGNNAVDAAVTLAAGGSMLISRVSSTEWILNSFA